MPRLQTTWGVGLTGVAHWFYDAPADVSACGEGCAAVTRGLHPLPIHPGTPRPKLWRELGTLGSCRVCESCVALWLAAIEGPL